MPNYAWNCHLCSKTNAPNTEACSECGFPASATGREIEKARLRSTPTESETPITPQKTGEMGEGTRIFFFFFGIYLLIGAGLTARDGKWFIGFPPQLDLAYFLFGSSTVGAYIEAALAAVIGVFCILGAFVKEKSNVA